MADRTFWLITGYNLNEGRIDLSSLECDAFGCTRSRALQVGIPLANIAWGFEGYKGVFIEGEEFEFADIAEDGVIVPHGEKHRLVPVVFDLPPATPGTEPITVTVPEGGITIKASPQQTI